MKTSKNILVFLFVILNCIIQQNIIEAALDKLKYALETAADQQELPLNAIECSLESEISRLKSLKSTVCAQLSLEKLDGLEGFSEKSLNSLKRFSSKLQLAIDKQESSLEALKFSGESTQCFFIEMKYWSSLEAFQSRIATLESTADKQILAVNREKSSLKALEMASDELKCSIKAFQLVAGRHKSSSDKIKSSLDAFESSLDVSKHFLKKLKSCTRALELSLDTSKLHLDELKFPLSPVEFSSKKLEMALDKQEDFLDGLFSGLDVLKSMFQNKWYLMK